MKVRLMTDGERVKIQAYRFFSGWCDIRQTLLHRPTFCEYNETVYFENREAALRWLTEEYGKQFEIEEQWRPA